MKPLSVILSKVRILPMLIMLVFGLANAVLAKSGGDYPNEKIRINPEYKISRISNGSVIVTSTQPGKKTVRHEFKDLYADVLLAANRKMGMEAMNNLLKKKYYLSEDDCRRELKHTINVLAEWKIIIREGTIAMR